MSLVELLLKEETSKGAYIWLIGHLTSADNASFSENDPLHQEDNKDDCAANLYVVQCNT